MNFKVDENLPVELARLLRNAGYDAVTVHDQQLNGCQDAELYAICRKENRIMVTLDLDFADIRSFPPDDSPGLIVLRLTNQARESILKWGGRAVDRLNSEPIAGRLWVVTEQGIRIRGGDST